MKKARVTIVLRLQRSRKLAATSSNIIIPHLVQLFLVLSLDGLSLAVDLSVGGDHSILLGVHLHHLELHGMHGLSDEKEVTFAQRTVSLQKVWLEVDVKEVARHSLDGVINRKNVHLLAVGNVLTSRHSDHVSKSDTQILSNDLSKTETSES